MLNDDEQAAIGHLLERIGIRTPGDAIRKLGLENEYGELQRHGVPAKVASRVLLVAYGRAVGAGGSLILQGVRGLFGGVEPPAGGQSFP